MQQWLNHSSQWDKWATRLYVFGWRNWRKEVGVNERAHKQADELNNTAPCYANLCAVYGENHNVDNSHQRWWFAFFNAVRGCRQPQLWVLLVPIENWLAWSSLDCYPARKAANVNQNAFGTFDLGPIAIVCCWPFFVYLLSGLLSTVRDLKIVCFSIRHTHVEDHSHSPCVDQVDYLNRSADSVSETTRVHV